MKLGLNLGFLTSANPDPVPLAEAAERLGYDSVWVAEAWGSDAVSLLAWVGARTSRVKLGTAILQIPSRSPALTAMTAASLDRLSGGRLVLGLGVSGPQVVEGWHGVPYGKPLARTREAVAIVRKVLARDEPLVHDGTSYTIPYPGGTGLGKPLKLMMAPARAEVPIYLAALGPKNVALASEIADGWLPIFYSPFHEQVFAEPLALGRSRRPEARRGRSFDVAPSVHVVVGDDVAEGLAKVKPHVALYVGGMGARGRNFYNDLARRYGYVEEAETIQELYLAGKKREAAAAVPDALVDQIALVGDRSRIAERLHAWEEAGVTTFIATPSSPADIPALAEIFARR